MKETSVSEAFYVLHNGYVRLPLAVNYSFNLSGNPEEPILFLLSGDVRGTAYCGAPSEINPGKGFDGEYCGRKAKPSGAVLPAELGGRNL